MLRSIWVLFCSLPVFLFLNVMQIVWGYCSSICSPTRSPTSPPKHFTERSPAFRLPVVELRFPVVYVHDASPRCTASISSFRSWLSHRLSAHSEVLNLITLRVMSFNTPDWSDVVHAVRHLNRSILPVHLSSLIPSSRYSRGRHYRRSEFGCHWRRDGYRRKVHGPCAFLNSSARPTISFLLEFHALFFYSTHLALSAPPYRAHVQYWVQCHALAPKRGETAIS